MSLSRTASKSQVTSQELPCGRVVEKTKKSTKEITQSLKNAVETLNAYCTEKKLNRSEAREKILEIIFKESHHFTAVELLEQLQKSFPEIGKATLYRNLPVLVDCGILKEGPHDSSGNALFEVADEDDHHDHIVCLDCKHIFEFHDDMIEKRQEQLTKKLGFSSQNHRHVVYASCDYKKNI